MWVHKILNQQNESFDLRHHNSTPAGNNFLSLKKRISHSPRPERMNCSGVKCIGIYITFLHIVTTYIKALISSGQLLYYYNEKRCHDYPVKHFV